MTDTKNEYTVVATAGTIPAVFLSVIPQKETSMSKMWPFLAGILVGATGIVVAACVVDNMAHSGDEALSEEEDEHLKQQGTPEKDSRPGSQEEFANSSQPV